MRCGVLSVVEYEVLLQGFVVLYSIFIPNILILRAIKKTLFFYTIFQNDFAIIKKLLTISKINVNHLKNNSYFILPFLFITINHFRFTYNS